MSYVHTPNFKNSRSRFPLPIKVVTGVVIILATLYFFAPRVLPSFFTTIASPLWRMENSIKDGNGVLPQAVTLQKNALLAENEELKNMLGRVSGEQMTLVAVLKKPPFSAYDVLILDIGSMASIKKKVYVYTEAGNIPIGEISEINGSTSKAKLYSSAGEKFDVSIGPSNIGAKAEGKGGGTFAVVLPRETNISRGDAVVIPGLSDAFMGTVEEIISDSSEPFATVLFRQPVNIFQIKWVLLEK